jgi:hypothetical protein
VDSGAAHGGAAGDPDPFQSEMFCPSIPAGVKQARHLSGLGIDTREIRAFMQITAVAGKSQIFGIIRAAVLASNDVLDVML